MNVEHDRRIRQIRRRLLWLGRLQQAVRLAQGLGLTALAFVAVFGAMVIADYLYRFALPTRVVGTVASIGSLLPLSKPQLSHPGGSVEETAAGISAPSLCR